MEKLLITKALTFIVEKKILQILVATITCLVTNIFQKFICIYKNAHGLEKVEGEFIMSECSFFWAEACL